MTFDDDFLRLPPNQNIALKTVGLEWPPPERISINGTVFVRLSMSEITDDQRSGMSHVCRGAMYAYADPVEGAQA